jgi:hypothetical protein
MAFKHVFDPQFKYRSADMTDVRLTFQRIRREQRKAERAAAVEAEGKVVARIGVSGGRTQLKESQNP